MDIGLPEWLDVARILGIGVIVMAVTQYIKTMLPEKAIRPSAIAIGIIISIAAGFYIGKPVLWVKAVVDGVLAAILADTGYQFLSKKPTSLSLPSKTDLEKKEGGAK